MAAFSEPASVIVVDVGIIDPDERHSMVFDTFAALPPGKALELVSDHDPEPLLEEFAAEQQGRFSWRCGKDSTDLWRVLIGKPISTLD